MRVPFLDIQAAHHEIRAELDEAYQRVMKSGWFVLGEDVERFEHDFARYCHVQHGVGIS
ncbi:MAG: erythromycin biosynthesis sensory transduction protein eryC1, partial [Xanthomonadales bacterium]|nr:erythromycin biosynthesis sensory transduction protein eryC1 [Xanthomonadales bacterium]